MINYTLDVEGKASVTAAIRGLCTAHEGLVPSAFFIDVENVMNNTFGSGSQELEIGRQYTDSGNPELLLVDPSWFFCNVENEEMTLEEFEAWVATAKFTDELGIEAGDQEKNDGHDDEGGERTLQEGYGCLWKISRATLLDGTPVQITHCKDASWSGTRATRYKDEFVSSESQGHEWEMMGVTLMDEDGDQMSEHEVSNALDAEFMRQANRKLTDNDIESLIPDVKVTEIETQASVTDTDLEEFEITNDNAPNIKFVGKQLVYVTGKDPYNNRNNGRWTNLTLYKTKGGKYVCEREGKTQWQGERNRSEAVVCTTEAEVIKFFGHGDVAKELYSAAGIEDVINVD